MPPHFVPDYSTPFIIFSLFIVITLGLLSYSGKNKIIIFLQNMSLGILISVFILSLIIKLVLDF